MATTIKLIKAYASILGLGALLVFTGCVKKHSDRVTEATGIYAIPGLNPSPDKIVTDSGDEVGSLGEGTYFVQDDYVGCKASTLSVGSLADNGKIVVSLTNGKTAACAKPSSLAKLKVKPEVTFYVAPKGTEYYILTREVVRTSGRTESPTGVVVEDGIGIKMLDVVDYTTNSPILNAIKDKVDLRALPGEKYKVYHKVTPKVLYVMKVASKDKLSHLDLPISDNLGNGEFAVPIAAVEIKLSQYRVVKNADGDSTNVYQFFPVETFEKATHIQYNFNNIKQIDLPDEVSKDVYPADYFTEGQWYVSESVVDTRPGSEGLIGTYTGAFDDNFRSASKIQFTRSSASLIACNVGIDERYADDFDCSKSSSVLTIPATGHAFEMNSRSDKVEEISILSSQAPFVKVEFNETRSIRKSIDELFSIIRDTNQDQLLELEFSSNKFAYVLQRGANGRRVKYSFLRVEGRPEYIPRRHYKDDRQNKFGYFTQEVAKIRSTDVIEREEDLEKDYLIQRHNPTQDIYYYFSNLTPESNVKDPYGLEIDYRAIGKKAIDYWNVAYEKAGAKNKIVLVTEKNGKPFNAPFGDIAYNTMNLIDSERGSNLLGVGPSLVDPYTGEVINANSNVYIAPFREIIARQVRNYIKAKLGYLEVVEKNLPPEGIANSTLLGEMAANVNGAKDVLAELIDSDVMKMVANLYHYGIADFSTSKVATDGFSSNGEEVANLLELGRFNSESQLVSVTLAVAKRIPELVTLNNLNRISFDPRSRKDFLKLSDAIQRFRPTFYRAYFASDVADGFNDYNSLTRQINEQCTLVTALVAKIESETPKGKLPVLTTAEELPALRHCMTQIIPDKFQATLIHEIGHTLGLRHNFYASADKNNFFNQKEVLELYGEKLRKQDLPRSSSVMDYVRTEQDRLTFPGHYDIAAIRYGYAGAVEVLHPGELSEKCELYDGTEDILDDEGELVLCKRPNTADGIYVQLDKGSTNEANGSIADDLKDKNLVVRPYEYCTDVEASLEIDPLCARHDFGTNPKMIVNDSINSFWESFAFYNFRYDRTSAGVVGPFSRSARMNKLKRIYNEWRVDLANYLGKEDSTGNEYLQRYSAKEYDNLITKLKSESTDFKGKDYLAVRDQIFDFVMDVAFFPNQYCIVETPVGLKAFEFSRLRDELRNQVPEGTKIRSCEDEEMLTLITEVKGYKYLYEAGLPVNNTWYFVNPRDTFEEAANFNSARAPIDVVGTFLDRYFASQFLGSRQSGYTGVIEKMFPSVLDEPDLYLKFETAMVDRLTKGVDLEEAVKRANKAKFAVTEEDEQRVVDAEGLVFNNYSEESALLKGLWLSLERGIRNQFANNAEKLSKYTRFQTEDPAQIQQILDGKGVAIPLTSGDTLLIPREATVAFALGEAFIEAQQFRNSFDPSVEIPTADALNKSLGFTVDRMSRMLPTDVESLTPENYLNFARQMNNMIGQAKPLQSEMLQNLYIPSLVVYLLDLQQADNAIQGALATGQQPPAEAVKLIQDKLASYANLGWEAVQANAEQELKNRNVNIPVMIPTSNLVIGIYNQAGAEIANSVVGNATYNKINYELNSDEMAAKADLLRAILLYDFAEVDQEYQLRFVEIFGDRASLENSSRPEVRDYINRHFKSNNVLNFRNMEKLYKVR